MPEIMVKGMSCGHCTAAVAQALGSLPGIKDVQVDLPSGRVTYASDRPVSQDELASAVRAAGYELAEQAG
jgi:copper chaperone